MLQEPSTVTPHAPPLSPILSHYITSHRTYAEYTVQSVKAVDDQGASVARRKARVLAAAVGEAFYAVR